MARVVKVRSTDAAALDRWLDALVVAETLEASLTEGGPKTDIGQGRCYRNEHGGGVYHP